MASYSRWNFMAMVLIAILQNHTQILDPIPIPLFAIPTGEKYYIISIRSSVNNTKEELQQKVHRQ